MIRVKVLGAWGTADIGETSSFLVESPEFTIVLDMCPGVARQLKREGFLLKDLDMAFGSHVHSDHLLGATYLLFQHSVETRALGEGEYKPFTFLGDKNVLETIDKVIKLHYPDRGFIYNSIECENNSIIDTGKGVIIKTSYNNHTVPTMAVRLEWENHSICYTSDGLLTPEVRELAKGVDLLIGEAFGSHALYQNRYLKVKHTLGREIGQLANECGVKMLMPFHMNPIFEKNSSRKEELISEIRESYKGIIIWPSEFKTIEI